MTLVEALGRRSEVSPYSDPHNVRSLRIGINCIDVNPAFVGGVTTYVLGLLNGFAEAESNCRFRLFVTSANECLFKNFKACEHFDLIVVDDRTLAWRCQLRRVLVLGCSSALYKRASDLLFASIRKLMDAHSDIIYTPTPVLSCFDSQKPTVLSMHDVQHLHYPEFFTWPRRLSRRLTYRLSARHANYFQASSNYIKADLIRHFPWLTASQIEVIPSGVLVETFAAQSCAGVLLAGRDIPDRFLLFPAQLWPHKNHLTVLKALKRIQTTSGIKVPLVLTGERFAAADGIFRFIAENSMDYVLHLGKVSLAEMVALNQKAAFMITATLHESSSLPILEAAAAGVPIIASRIPPIEEIGKVLQINFFEPLDVDQLSDLVFRLWNDNETGSKQAAHNSKCIRSYSWRNTAKGYIELFGRIASARSLLQESRNGSSNL